MDLQAVWRVLRAYRWFLALGTLSGVLATAGLLWFVVTPMYRAETSLLLLKNSPGGVSALLRQLEGSLDMLGSLQNLGIQANRSVQEDVMSLLKSRRLTQSVQAQLPLRALPEFQRELELSAQQEAQWSEETRERFYQHQVTERLQELVRILPPDARHHTLRIQAELSDPELSARLVNTYVSDLHRLMEEILNQEENEQLQYLKAQTETLQKELTTAENDLLAFQQKHHTVVLEEEVKQRIKALAELEAQALSAEAAFKDAQARQQALQGSVAELSPESTLTRNSLELDIAGLQQRRRSLQQAQNAYTASLRTLPSQGLALARLQRQVSLKNQLFLLLKQQTQATELDQQRQFKAFRVLDAAEVPFEPSRPVKPLWLAVSCVLSFFLCLLLSLIHHNNRLQKAVL